MADVIPCLQASNTQPRITENIILHMVTNKNGAKMLLLHSWNLFPKCALTGYFDVICHLYK